MFNPILKRAVMLGAASLAMSGAASAAALVSAADHFFPTSGSTALDNAIKEYFTLSGGICQAGSLQVFVDGVDLKDSSTHQTLVVCKSSQKLGTVNVGDTIGLAKESNGGSLEGTINVARGTALNFLDALNAAGISCTGAATGKTAGTYYANQQALTISTGCTTLNAYAPTIGWADEAPQAWQGFGARPISTADINALNTDPLVQNVFGIAVSLNMYRALQKMQGLTTTDDTLASMPKLTSAAITAIYSNNLGDWSLLTDASGTAVNAAANTAGHTVPGTVFVCRRGDSSGTNASIDLLFLGQRCSSSPAQMIQATTANANCKNLPSGLSPEDFGCAWQASNLTDVVFPGSGGGDVSKCLHAHDQANQFAIGNLTTNSSFDDPSGAGGSGDTVGAAHFRFVAIDGRQPTLVAVANGQYPFVEDNVLNTKTTAGGNVQALRTLITGSTGGFANETIVRDFVGKQASAKTSAGASTSDPDWTTGVLFDALNSEGIAQNALPVSTTTLTTAAGHPVSNFTQVLGGLNNCQPPIAVGGVINK